MSDNQELQPTKIISKAAADDDDGVFSRDLLRGAAAIAEFLFGSRDSRRAIYHLRSSSNIPIFRIGATLCARRSSLVRYFADQEDR